MPLDKARLDRFGPDRNVFDLAIITDEDQDSQVELDDGQIAWQSRMRYDTVRRTVDDAGRVRYSFEPQIGHEHQLLSTIAEAGRGAEFSELVSFNGKLLAFDDRTGLVCEIRHEHELIPRTILITGPGDAVFKGFKCEWATIYGDELIVGSHGKVAKSGGGPGHEEWVKRIQPNTYQVISRDWSAVYERMRKALGVDRARGYVTHEAADFDPERRRWLFFPRKVSFEPFDEPTDEREKGNNLLLDMDADFGDIQVREIGPKTPERGPSSLKIVPGHPDEVVATKSVEIGDRTETYILAFDIHGNVLSDEVKIGDFKCEGVEFVG